MVSVSTHVGHGHVILVEVSVLQSLSPIKIFGGLTVSFKQGTSDPKLIGFYSKIVIFQAHNEVKINDKKKKKDQEGRKIYDFRTIAIRSSHYAIVLSISKTKSTSSI